MNEDYISFDQYLENELSDEAKILFEEKLKTDSDFLSNFLSYKLTNAQLKHKFGDELKNFEESLIRISKENSNKPRVLRLKPWYFAMAAASIAIFFSIFFMNSNPSFEEYNRHENAFFTERGIENNELKKAEEAFNAKKYKQAIPIFKSILKTNSNPEVDYFYGIALLENNQIQESETVFNSLKTNLLYKNKAIWYLALSKLKQKNYTACKDILMTIPTDYENYEQVTILIKDLN
jgi:hypothetical protein